MLLEVRTYRIIEGELDRFVQVMAEECVPLLRLAGIDVVATGRSLCEEDGRIDAFLIRRFQSVSALEEQESRFYGGQSWRAGPREAILSRIVSYHSVVFDGSVLAGSKST
ncbi:MAG: hypothetical protein ABIP33_07330 [Pseudolysinimonas sp.]